METESGLAIDFGLAGEKGYGKGRKEGRGERCQRCMGFCGVMKMLPN